MIFLLRGTVHTVPTNQEFEYQYYICLCFAIPQLLSMADYRNEWFFLFILLSYFEQSFIFPINFLCGFLFQH